MARSPNPELAAEKERIEKILAPLTLTERQRIWKLLTKFKRGIAKISEIKELNEAGVIGRQDKNGHDSASYDSQTALAAALSVHFNGRLKSQITKQAIQRWKSGRGIPAGAPTPPPNQGSGRMPFEPWVYWVENYVVKRGNNGHTNGKLSKFDEAEEARAEREIIARNAALREEQIATGEYIPVSQHVRDLQTVGQVLNAALTEHAEKRLTASVLEAAKVLAVDEARMNDFTVALRQAVEQAADGLRQTLADALNNIHETTSETR